MRSSYRVLGALSLLMACTGPAEDEPVVDNDSDGFTVGLDCDDNNASINPNADEMCDGVDNNCDGNVDDASAVDRATWYADSDKDGFGDATVTELACAAPDGYTSDATDCDDRDPALRPDDQDSDGYSSCDGDCDDTDATLTPDDLDGDGYAGCDGDCDDTKDNWYPAELSVETVDYSYDADGSGTFVTPSVQTNYRDENNNIVLRDYRTDNDGDGTPERTDQNAYEYDADGNLVLMTQDVVDVSYSFTSETSYTYDAAGNQLTYSYREDSGRDGEWNYLFVQEYTYDSDGLLVTEVFRNDTDGDGSWDNESVNYNSYDGNGNRVFWDRDTDNDGNIDHRTEWAYTYDAAFNITEQRRLEDDSYDGVYDVMYISVGTYDAAGNQLTWDTTSYASDFKTPTNKTEVSKTYDSANNVLRWVVTQDYNADGRFDNRQTREYTYTADNQVSTLVFEYDYTGDGAPNIGYSLAYIYGEDGNPVYYIEEHDYDMDGTLDYAMEKDHSYLWACF